jgi:DNA repair protein RadA/Sms
MPTPIPDVADSAGARWPTGVGELDRVLGGGLVPGSVTLLGGEPGMGKSTLLLQALGSMARAGARCLLVGAEESPEQVRLRAQRVGALESSLLLVGDTELPRVLAHADAVEPDVLAIDSIQAVADPDASGAPGSVTQVRECAYQLVRLAKERELPIVLVGHVTKDGSLAGPRSLEHVVDTVCAFDGDRHHTLRFLHALKHRFGSTQELGILEMTEGGLVDVPDASALFLADRRAGMPGSFVAPVLEGSRPLLVEVQALVAERSGPTPRRSATGVDASRLALLLAVLGSYTELGVGDRDVYASVAGGVRVAEPGLDLAVALAVAGASRGLSAPPGVVALGEVGLAGEIRQVPRTAQRLAEAARLGFTHVVGPPSLPAVAGLVGVPVDTIGDALVAVFDAPAGGTACDLGTRAA